MEINFTDKRNKLLFWRLASDMMMEDKKANNTIEVTN